MKVSIIDLVGNSVCVEVMEGAVQELKNLVFQHAQSNIDIESFKIEVKFKDLVVKSSLPEGEEIGR